MTAHARVLTKAVMAIGVAALITSALAVAPRALGAPGQAAGPRVGQVLEVSRGCGGQNAEVEQAVDLPYVYEVWIGCHGIGFARSVNGGRSFEHPVRVPGSAGSGSQIVDGRYLPKYGWDPAIAVAPDGTVYVSYMIFRHHYAHPVVAVSTDHGAAFVRTSAAMPPAGDKDNWGDRDFIAVSRTGTVYLTWDFGPALSSPDANIVIQKSINGGRTWSAIRPVSPGYPSHGGDVAGPLVIGPGGRLDVLLWVLADPGLPGYALPPGHDYFTSSMNGGQTWSKPVMLGPRPDKITGLLVGWIDADIGIDSGGTLYATWDTQRPGGDVGWLAYSTNGGKTWSHARRATPDHDSAGHIMAVIGGRRGVAYVGWLAGGPIGGTSPRPFSQYLRVFSVHNGWLTGPIRLSRAAGNATVWPGDTIGISVLGSVTHSPRLIVSWGGALTGLTSQIWASTVRP